MERRLVVVDEAYLKRINFIPGCESILTAFVWEETHEGYEYWSKRERVMDLESITKWREMERVAGTLGWTKENRDVTSY
jgi:hypothetical protein